MTTTVPNKFYFQSRGVGLDWHKATLAEDGLYDIEWTDAKATFRTKTRYTVPVVFDHLGSGRWLMMQAIEETDAPETFKFQYGKEVVQPMVYTATKEGARWYITWDGMRPEEAEFAYYLDEYAQSNIKSGLWKVLDEPKQARINTDLSPIGTVLDFRVNLKKRPHGSEDLFKAIRVADGWVVLNRETSQNPGHSVTDMDFIRESFADEDWIVDAVHAPGPEFVEKEEEELSTMDRLMRLADKGVKVTVEAHHVVLTNGWCTVHVGFGPDFEDVLAKAEDAFA